MAEQALELAIQVGDPTSEARSRNVLGLIDEDREQLAIAVAILERAEPGPGLWDVRLGLARAAWAAADDEAALEQLELISAEAHDWSDIFQRARIEAPAHHLAAAVLRRLGQPRKARARQRQADLSLSLLPKHQAVPLRAAVAMGLGNDLAGLRQFDAAFESHSQASSLYRRIGDRQGELVAQRSLGDDLAGLGRLLDAADQAGRAMRTALASDDVESARSIALKALGWLDAVGTPASSHRRRVFEEALAGLPISEAADG